MRIFKIGVFPLDAAACFSEAAQQGWSSAQCGHSFSCMPWSMSSVINVATLKKAAVGSTFCPQMHVCGFRASMGSHMHSWGENLAACVYTYAYICLSVYTVLIRRKRNIYIYIFSWMIISISFPLLCCTKCSYFSVSLKNPGLWCIAIFFRKHVGHLVIVLSKAVGLFPSFVLTSNWTTAWTVWKCWK